MLERLQHLNLGAAYLALIAVGAIGGATVAAGRCAIAWARGRRT